MEEIIENLFWVTRVTYNNFMKAASLKCAKISNTLTIIEWWISNQTSNLIVIVTLEFKTQPYKQILTTNSLCFKKIYTYLIKPSEFRV